MEDFEKITIEVSVVRASIRALRDLANNPTNKASVALARIAADTLEMWIPETLEEYSKNSPKIGLDKGEKPCIVCASVSR